MRNPLPKLIARFLTDKRGTTAVEYGMICALVFLVAISAMSAFAKNATTVFNTAAAAISGHLK